MVMKKPTEQTDRFLLAYFMESKVWKKFEASVVNNQEHWVVEDPNRARRMLAARALNKKGYTIAEIIYDMVDCVYSSNLKPRTKNRLYNDLDMVERWHEFMNTLEVEL